MFYYRRKIILAILSILGGTLTAKQLHKYLFLFTREQSDKSFDFIPNKYGCYSFIADQDLAVLEKKKYINVSEGSKGRQISLREKTNYTSILNIFDQQILHDIKSKYGLMSQNELIRYTYLKYPYYAINSKILDDLLTKEEISIILKQKRSLNTKCLFTIGYEGKSLETYINKLIINDVKVLVDVRKNAFSMKYGFSKKELCNACESVNVKYLHVPSLGIISEKRTELNCQDDYDKLFNEYEKTTLLENYNSLLSVNSLWNSNKRIALTCFEKNPLQCHRTIVARNLLKIPKKKEEFKEL